MRGRRARDLRAERFVHAWLALGFLALAFWPLLNGAAPGRTPLYWLVAAPLIDLAWLRRRRIAALLRDAAAAVASAPRGAVRVR